jgi:hypothetical protein
MIKLQEPHYVSKTLEIIKNFNFSWPVTFKFDLAVVDSKLLKNLQEYVCPGEIF